jgi:hypothetical protein
MRGPGVKIPNGPVTNGAFRLGSGAARSLAGAAARGLIPGVGLALGVAWLASNCFEKQGSQWVRTCFAPGQGPQVSDGYEYRMDSDSPWEAKYPACDRGAGRASDREVLYRYVFKGSYINNGYPYVSGCVIDVVRKSDGVVMTANTSLGINVQPTTCPVGWYHTSAGCLQTPPPAEVMTPEQIEEEMAPKPLPQQMPPGIPYPLDPSAPFIFEPDAANPPNAQRIRIPQGNGIPVPNTNPQQFRQPVTRFSPMPTLDDPFRLDVRPEEMVSNSPVQLTGPTPVDSQQGEKPPQLDLCKEHPDVIACQVFKPDELEPTPIPNKDKPMAITPDGGWGLSNASCPANKTASLSFGPIAFSYEPLCLFADGIRPMVIALAWFSAALTFFGFARKDT